MTPPIGVVLISYKQATPKSPSAAVRYTGRTQQYASFLILSRALHPGIFEQPVPYTLYYPFEIPDGFHHIRMQDFSLHTENYYTSFQPVMQCFPGCACVCLRAPCPHKCLPRAVVAALSRRRKEAAGQFIAGMVIRDACAAVALF